MTINRQTLTDVLVTALVLLVVMAISTQISHSKVAENNELLRLIKAKLDLNANSIEDVRLRLREVEREDSQK